MTVFKEPRPSVPRRQADGIPRGQPFSDLRFNPGEELMEVQAAAILPLIE
jgi:hypothetical protein